MKQEIDPRFMNKAVQKEILTLLLKAKGGSSRSPAKVAATRENAKKATKARLGKKFAKKTIKKIKIKPAEDWS